SVAVKFDLYPNVSEGWDSTGNYTNPASPTTPFVDMTNTGIDLHSGHVLNVHMIYDGSNLAMSITDNVVNKSFATSWPINIPATVGGNTAFVGFTGGTGGNTAIQDILNWTYSTGQQPAATPAFSLPGGTYLGTQTVTISDSTAGATIFYTMDGTTPTTSSTVYTGPITVSTSETVEAMAAESGFFNSNVSTAVYTITSSAATPVITPGTGTYTSAQTVTITDGTTGASIYYTLDGSQPTTTSTQYTASFKVSTTTTVKAIATATNFTTSATATSVITIQSGMPAINFGSGFTAGGMVLNGNTTLNGARLRLTDGGGSEAGSGWYPVAVNVQTFTTDFSLQITPGTTPTADGMTFTIQNAGTNALGPAGGGLGYGWNGSGVTQSVAVKFDLYPNVSEGWDSTGIYTNAASPTTPFVDMTNTGIDLHSGHVLNVHMSYDGSNLAMSITDNVVNKSFATSWPINIPATVGGNTAFVGFTGGTGGNTAIQDILNWTYSTGQQPAATPTLSLPGG